ncbi:MAG: FAD-dependent oxidoreductase [Eubacteriales bacterium]|nr:FAD-dependent oxidoreductase [Eubacteriales bacterium]
MQNKISRRAFLKGTGAGIAGLAVSNLLSFGAAAEAAENETAEAPAFNATSNDGLTNVDVSAMKELTTDVVVIGGGGAGISASIAAAEAGKNVIIIEKIGFLGGTTMLSSGIIPATGTDEQIAFGVETDSVGANARDILRPSNYSVRQDLVYTVAENAKDMVDWLRGMGVKWTLMDSLFYGQSEYRMHQAEGSGAGMTSVMIEHLKSFDTVTTMINTTVEGLLVEDGKVVGCYGTDENKEAFAIKAENTVLATTGFGNNDEMIAKYCPEVINAVKVVSTGATGEGIKWGAQLGAELANMGAYQGYAFHTVDNNKSGEQGILNNGGIFVNEQGRRFCNEYGGYSEITPHVLAQSNSVCWEIFTDAQAELCSLFETWKEAEILYQGNTVEELAAAIGVDAAALTATVDAYKKGIENGQDVWNRCHLPENFDGPYYAVKNTGEIRHTQGGVVTDVAGHVLKEDGSLIPGLYAAGGCTEGFSSGDGAAYMSGNGLLQCLIFGKIAGTHAATETADTAAVATWEYSDIDA